MSKFVVHSPVQRFSGDVAGLVFRDGRADADSAADAAALAYCRRRGYTVEPLDVSLEDEAETVDAPEQDVEVERPADYASKAEWVTYAVARGVSDEDAKAATKNELIELYG